MTALVIEPIFSADTSQMDASTLLSLIGSLSRNRYLVQLLDTRDEVLGELELKGSMVLSATHHNLTGKEAFDALLRSPARMLEAFHAHGGELPGLPVGRLEDLLLQHAVEVDHEQRLDPELFDTVGTSLLGSGVQPVEQGNAAVIQETVSPEAAVKHAPALPLGMDTVLAGGINLHQPQAGGLLEPAEAGTEANSPMTPTGREATRTQPPRPITAKPGNRPWWHWGGLIAALLVLVRWMTR